MVTGFHMIMSIDTGRKRIPGNERGAYAVEAAIFLPIFILAVLTLGYMVKIIGVWENVNHGAVDQVTYSASKAYVEKTSIGDRSGIISRVEDENPAVSHLKIEKYRYLYPDGENNNLINLQISYRVNIDLPLAFRDGVDVKQRWLTRGFTGARSANGGMPFSEMEQDGGGTVWVFPESGERYHGENCTYVKAHAREVILTEGIRSKFSPCSLCDSGELHEGSVVYCFFSYGESYHRGDCKSVDRYTVEMSREEAEKEGYTPCSKCGGE